jgi:hypothetical protein
MLFVEDEQKEITFNPHHTVTVAVDELSDLAFNWAVAQVVGEPIQVEIYDGYKEIIIESTKRWDSYSGENLRWQPVHHHNLMHEIVLKYKVGVMPLDEAGNLWEARFFDGSISAQALNPHLAVLSLLVRSHYGELATVPTELQCQEQFAQEFLEEQRRAKAIDQQFDNEDDLYLIEERIRRLNP